MRLTYLPPLATLMIASSCDGGARYECGFEPDVVICGAHQACVDHVRQPAFRESWACAEDRGCSMPAEDYCDPGTVLVNCDEGEDVDIEGNPITRTGVYCGYP